MKAKVIIKRGKLTPNGPEARMEVRAGEKGTGELIGAVNYWPWSGISCDEADRIVAEIAERNELELSW